MRLVKFACSLLLVLSYEVVAAHAQDLSGFFKGVNGAFVVYDMKHDRYVRYNERRCRQRFSPKSTFKIPNSLIGLDTGVIRDAEFVIQWNREKYPPQANWTEEPFVQWGKDQTLRSAIKYSVLWYYRELALGVGGQQMKKYVSAFDYGNVVRRFSAVALSVSRLMTKFGPWMQLQAHQNGRWLAWPKFFPRPFSLPVPSTFLMERGTFMR